MNAIAKRRAAREHSLELVFVEKAGRRETALSNMPVRITDACGHVVFDGASPGPCFYARLPKGRYTISTRWDAWSWSREVRIGEKGPQRVVFAWSKAAEAAPQL